MAAPYCGIDVELLAAFEHFREPSPPLADGDKVALHYRLTFTARASGEGAELRMAEVFTVRDSSGSWRGRATTIG